MNKDIEKEGEKRRKEKKKGRMDSREEGERGKLDS